ncbi:MAG: cytidylate kinase family protein [Bryobacteraceae bacterium]
MMVLVREPRAAIAEPARPRQAMGLITVTGAPGSRHEEAARLIAQRLGFELVSEVRLAALIEEEFGPPASLPDKAYPELMTSILARLATEHHLVVTAEGAERVLPDFPGLLRVCIVAPESRRVGVLMVERGLERPAARELLRQLEAEEKARRRRRFGRSLLRAEAFDLVLNTERLEPEEAAEIVAAAAQAHHLPEQGLLSAAAEAHLQFQTRLKLSRFGITPAGKLTFRPRRFSHPSEEIFANLLDFYRVAWEYEPRTFPLQWDRHGNVIESFTPDFYLPQFDLYVELTTMKQSLVTRKNRKIKLLRQIYPDINIQVFYQKDFENLIFKYGLSRLPAGPPPRTAAPAPRSATPERASPEPR